MSNEGVSMDFGEQIYKNCQHLSTMTNAEVYELAYMNGRRDRNRENGNRRGWIWRWGMSGSRKRMRFFWR